MGPLSGAERLCYSPDPCREDEAVSAGERGRPQPRCPLRPGEPCTLCQMNVTGPQDCGLVYLVMDDDELRQELRRSRLAAAR